MGSLSKIRMVERKELRSHYGQAKSAGRKRANRLAKKEDVAKAAKKAKVGITEIVKRRELEAERIRAASRVEMNSHRRPNVEERRTTTSYYGYGMRW